MTTKEIDRIRFLALQAKDQGLEALLIRTRDLTSLLDERDKLRAVLQDCILHLSPENPVSLRAISILLAPVRYKVVSVGPPGIIFEAGTIEEIEKWLDEHCEWVTSDSKGRFKRRCYYGGTVMVISTEEGAEASVSYAEALSLYNLTHANEPTEGR
jgi:hypothetical protein